MWRRVSALLPSLSRAGFARVTLGRGFGGLPPQAREDARALNSSPRELRSNREEFLELPIVFEQAKALRSLGSKPLTVVTAGLGQQSGWAAAQDKLAQLARNSVQRTIPGATHSTLLEDQKFAAIASRAIADLVERPVRSGVRPAPTRDGSPLKAERVEDQAPQRDGNDARSDRQNSRQRALVDWPVVNRFRALLKSIGGS